MLSLLWPLSESMYLIILKKLVCQLVASGSYLNQLMTFRLLGHLIMIHGHILCIQIFTLELKNIQGPPGPQLEIYKHGKNIHILDENIPYLEGEGGGGGSESLDQKNLPRVVFAIPGPPCSNPVSDGSNSLCSI